MFFKGTLGETGVRSETHPHPYNDYPRKTVYQSSVYTATELFYWKPYKFAVVKKLQKENCVAKGTVL
jgi:hypothetical protein